MPDAPTPVEIPTSLEGLADAVLELCADATPEGTDPVATPLMPFALLAEAVKLHQERIAARMKPVPDEVLQAIFAIAGGPCELTPALRMVISAAMQGRDKMNEGGTPFDLPRKHMQHACDFGAELVMDDLRDAGHEVRIHPRAAGLLNTVYAAGLATGEQLAKARW